MDFTKILQSENYNFIRSDERLKERVMLLGVCGSYAYGTNNKESDIDFRGVTLMRPSDLIGFTEFEQFEERVTDTVIYSFNKFVRLLLKCNPNALEILGLKKDDYVIRSNLGRELLDNARLFLSKRVIKSYGSFANAQLRRLQNAQARDTLTQVDRERHILRSVQYALDDFNNKHEKMDGVRLYIDDSDNPEYETEIFVDAEYKHYPLRDYANLWETMRLVVHSYDKVGGRKKKKDDKHLNKHAMHLVRLLAAGADILETGEIHTRNDTILPLLLSIRNGEYMQEDGTFSTRFYEVAREYETKFDEAARRTQLPEEPDGERIEVFVERVNRYVITEVLPPIG